MATTGVSRMRPPTVVCLVAVALMVVVDLVASEGSSYGQTFQGSEVSPDTYQGAQDSGFSGPILNKVAIKREMIRQLQIPQEAEETIPDNECEPQVETTAPTNPTSSHFNNMCIFNVVACYLKG